MVGSTPYLAGSRPLPSHSFPRPLPSHSVPIFSLVTGGDHGPHWWRDRGLLARFGPPLCGSSVPSVVCRRGYRIQ
ncbi:hypothetical protein PAHAL_7G123100 [Panicum hallii]|uniref:Uncharacterized protein n=1 Tax=Panicum hallii TaxID=206008 RepID=A0A2T8IC23_9POAL|nr:hypothetical protein PAHAL_7G123100 [Panicum hallii]